MARTGDDHPRPAAAQETFNLWYPAVISVAEESAAQPGHVVIVRREHLVERRDVATLPDRREVIESRIALVELDERQQQFGLAVRVAHVAEDRDMFIERHQPIQFLVRRLGAAEAEGCFRTMIAAKGPAAALGWFGISGVRARQGKPAETVAALRQSVTIQPKFTLGWLFLCAIEARQGHFSEGADAARHLTSLQPKLGLGWGVLGYCESGQKKYDGAITDYRHAIAVAPKYAFAYEGLGICYTITNRPADAVAPLKNALALAQRDYLAATELGYCYLRCGQYDDCLKVCHQATAIRPGYSKAWDVLGLCYRHTGKKREALESFRHAVESAPNDPAVRAHYVEASKAFGLA